MRKFYIALFALAALLAFGGMAVAQDAAVAANENVIVKKIELAGNYEVSDDQILGVIQTKTGEPVSTQKLEDDLQRIFDLGFFSEDVKVALSEFEGGAKITFKVVENPSVGKINITGNKSIATDTLLGLMATRENKILNKNSLKDDVAAIEKHYKDNGYIVARVGDLGIDASNNLNIQIMEGEIQSIEIVYILKNDETGEELERKPAGKTKPVVILREMKTKKGDTLNIDRLKRDLQRVFNLGFFDDVSWDFNTDPSSVELGKIVLQIQIQEAKTGQVGFGAGYSNNTGLTGFLSYSERNLRGMGRRVSTQLEFGKKRDEFQIGYFEPWIDRKQTSLEVNVYNTSSQNLQYGLGGVASTDYEELHRGMNFTVGRPVSDNTRAYVGLKAETVNVDPEQYDYLDGAARSISFSLRTDTRDNIFFPTTGRYDTGTVESNGSFLGGDYTYQKLSFDFRRFFPIKKKQAFGAHAFIGLTKDEVPRFDYYDIGGVNTVRGYEEYEYSGRKAMYFNAEYRLKLGGNVSGVAFADAGGVWNDLSDMGFDPKDYVKSVGAGIRLTIPQLGMGPIRLDYAYAISKKDSRIHFGFGHMF